MNPKIVNFGPVKVAGYLHKTSHSNNTIPAFWGEIFSDGRHEKLHQQDFVKKHGDYGVCFDCDDDNMSYIIGLEVKDGAQIPEEFHQHEIKQGLYAVLSTPPLSGADFSKSIQKSWGDLYNWLEGNAEYANANGSEFELYNCTCAEGVECEACKTGLMTCDVYVNVVRKGGK